MYITANVCVVSPVIYINVLDPKKHKKDLTETAVKVDEYQAMVESPAPYQVSGISV